MEGPDIPGPKIWLNLNRKSEQKIISHINYLQEKSSWMSPFLDSCKAQIAKLKAGQAGHVEPVMVSKTPRAKINRKARRSAISPPGSHKVGSGKKSKKTRKSSKSAKAGTPDQSASGVVFDDAPLAERDDENPETAVSEEVPKAAAESVLNEGEVEDIQGVADQSPTVIEAILSQTEVVVEEVDKKMNVSQVEGSDEVFTVEDTVQEITSADKEASSPVNATCGVDEATNGTFVLEAVTDSSGADQELQTEDGSEPVDATFNIAESANETFDVASTGPGVTCSLAERTNVDNSDADAESEAFEDADSSAGRSKSLRKTRTLSLQKKRALHLSTESDSDSATATPPATKTRKVDTTLTRTVEKVVTIVPAPSASAQELPSTSTRQEPSVLARVTRSKSASQSVSDSTSDCTPVSRSRISMRRSSRGVRKSSVSASLLKVSAARGASVSELLATQEVILTKPVPTDTAIPSPIMSKGKSGPAIRTTVMATPSSTLNNSRAPAGKIVRPGKKVFASGGRGVSPATGPRSGGMSGGSQGGMRSRSRMDIINRSGQRTPSGARTPTRVVVKGRDGSKPRGGGQLDEIQEQKEIEMKRKEEKEADAKQRREELLKKKADDQREKREARIKRVQDARQKQEVQKGSKHLEKEKAEKLAALKKREEAAKAEVAKKKFDDEEAARKEEEKVTEARAKLAEEAKRIESEKVREAKRVEAELLVAKEKAAHSLLAQTQLNGTYSKPGDTTANFTMDQTQGVSSYDMTPARHELPPEPSQDEENYGLDDLNSDEDTDDEDCPRKVVPKWAEGSQLRTALLKQCYMGPDLDMIFANVEMPDLSTMFAQQRKRFFKRTSSAVWETPPESFKHASRKR